MPAAAINAISSLVLCLLFCSLLPCSSFHKAARASTITASKRHYHHYVTLDRLSSVTAEGTPFERPKIGNSVVDVIGGTPMVGNVMCALSLAS